MKLLVQKMASANTKIIYREKNGARRLEGIDFGEDSLSEGAKNVTANSNKIKKIVSRNIDEDNPKLKALDESILNGDATIGSL